MSENCKKAEVREADSSEEQKVGSEGEAPLAQNLLTMEDVEDRRKLIVVLVKCPLEVAKLRKQAVLLNSDDHKQYINSKLNRDWALYRPDITHQSLLTLMDSPLNKAGLLQVYVSTANGVLIKISPNTKIPRTYNRFAALMAQLLTKLKIRAV